MLQPFNTADIVLCYPRLEAVKSRLLPMSLLSLAAPFIQAGYRVKIIDQRVDGDWQNTLREALKNQPLLVGISVMTGRHILNAIEISKLIKKNSNTPIIWGGVHPSLLPKQTLKNSYIDFVAIGEGEMVLLNLAELLKNGQSFENIAGLGYKKQNKIFINQPISFINLDDLPDIPYHLINIENYVRPASFASGRPGRCLDFYTSRGCPHACSFCYNQEFNKRKWRSESAERVVTKIKNLINKYQITALDINDDEFFVDLERVKKICELILKENIQIEIFSNCRINYLPLMDDGYLNLLKKAGFHTLAFGVESGSERAQKLMHKDIDNRQVLEAVLRLKKAGLESKYYFMAGMPKESVGDLYHTTDLIQKMKQLDHNIRIPAWRIFTPFPGTDLYNQSVACGFMPPKNLEEWAEYDFTAVQMPWVRGALKRIINNVIYALPFLGLSNDKTNKSWYFKFGRFYGRTVDIRFKNHWFYFPEEFFINIFLKIKHNIYE